MTIHLPARDIPPPTTISPEAQAMVGAMAPPPQTVFPALDDKEAWRTIVAERDVAAMQMMAPLATISGVSRDHIDAGGVRTVVAWPDTIGEDDRILFDVHGGALIQMGGEICTVFAGRTAMTNRMRIWSPDYRMPPDHPYPTPLDDCMAAYRHLLESHHPSRVVVSGTSAGGNLAAALVVRARDEGVPLPAALVLNTPEVDLTESGDSFTTNLGLDNILTLLRPVNELYANGEDLRHPYVSPLFADLTGLPPTILTTGTRDLFLSNTVLMHRALRRAGVHAELHVLEAASHGAFFGRAPEDREIVEEIRGFIDRHCPPHAA